MTQRKRCFNNSTSFADKILRPLTAALAAMNSSVHTGSSSTNGSHALHHCPGASTLSQAGVASAPLLVRLTPVAAASSSKIGAPGLQEWMDISEAFLRIIGILSGVGPARKAA